MAPNNKTANLKKERVNQTSTKKDGTVMTCIEYFDFNNITVQFPDGTIRKNVNWREFMRGKVARPEKAPNRDKESRLNQTSKTKNGTPITCIEYFDATNITVQFPDGAITKNITWSSFINGQVPRPERTRNAQRKARLNKTSITKDGIPMKCIEYINSKNITIQFPDGSIRKNIHWDSFIKGSVTSPKKIEKLNSKVNQTSTKKDGTVMTCIEYFNINNITVQFPDGTIRKNIQWDNFLKGNVAKTEYKRIACNKKARLNQTSITKDGIPMTCIEYFDSSNVTVQFPDGTIRKKISWKNFIEGVVASPEKIKNANHINETNTANNGLKMTIIETESGKNPTIQFEDGYITKNSSYANFRLGCVTHNTLKTHKKSIGCIKGTLYNTKISGIAHNYRNTAHYFCECQICKTREIWNFEQIKNHECNNQTANKDQHTNTDNT